jgi:hypothetical protein
LIVIGYRMVLSGCGVTAWNETGADVRITRAQIAEAQRLSTEWIEAHPGGN